MNTLELISALKNNEITKDNFGGVFPSDQLPIKPIKLGMRSPKYYIINLDPSTKSGSHWVVCFLTDRKNKDIYFDSYGYPPMVESLSDFMGTNPYLYNSKQLQHPLTSSCGQWCLYFIYYKLTNNKNSLFFKPFTKNLLKNDTLINTWVNKTFKLNQEILDTEFISNQIAKKLIDNKQIY